MAISLGSPAEWGEGERRRRRRRSGSSSTKPWAISLGSSAEWVEGERRRRRRSGSSSALGAVKTKPIPNPIPDKQLEINSLAQEIANQAAERYLECIPPEIKSALSDEQIKFQQKELSVGIKDALRSQFSWALNQAWFEAKNSNQNSKN